MEPIQPADVWEDAVATRAVHELEPSGFRRLVVVCAHPDDETLGAAGLLRGVAAAGGTVEVVLASDGEAALPEIGGLDRAALARTRRAELDAALAELGVSATVHRLGMPDSALRTEDLVPALMPYLGGADAWASPWRADPHPDHAAVAEACRAAAPVTVHGFGFPVWARTRCDPHGPDVPWERGHRLRLSPGDRAAKRRAIAAHASQTAVPAGGSRAVLSAATLEHFHGTEEVYFREPPATGAPPELFAARYRDDPDPWRVRSSWYERRKQAVLLASLPREHYGLAAEPGCGIGELTRALASRCRRLVATDAVDEAVSATTAAVADAPGVEVARADVDDARAVPDGADLVVLSEFLYYLPAQRVTAVLDRVATALEPGGDLALVHWRRWPAEAPADAATVHGRVRDDDRFRTVVDHTDEEFLLLVVRRR
ncbi:MULTISPECIES: bifunctional PIG-L family deacetylase/class I SAM-dependent methyltransferase [unclassified Pseudonocardia]|uniref:bifunctional PIG-L family deacetylase/class I SAM-dependent methyltransferase n=1 Tax=unclassified Pseudonocardia TaxID=2619320 RepID=UPI00095F11CD|nr:bifunctional PIG-L family deacetylase/class I SAM-dependent methyltransferase [Pseudonocardia sp. Ae707_Ps1]OLM19894.1 Methyltransferase type 12 [Pseudonocardia sp. Ae707_Ps1]